MGSKSRSRNKAARPRPWNKDYAPYGRYEGARGSEAEWRATFASAWHAATAEEIVGQESPWEILGVQAGAALDEVKRRFRALMRAHHPDHAAPEDKAAATELTRRIIAAYTVLTDTQSRVARKRQQRKG